MNKTSGNSYILIPALVGLLIAGCSGRSKRAVHEKAPDPQPETVVEHDGDAGKIPTTFTEQATPSEEEANASNESQVDPEIADPEPDESKIDSPENSVPPASDTVNPDNTEPKKLIITLQDGRELPVDWNGLQDRSEDPNIRFR